jgi:predicted  nucleic acid-binding Zn-ribbon protein
VNGHLERLIALQRLDSARQNAERRIAEAPERQRALDGRLEEARERVAAAKQQLADSQAARRAIEKDVALHQGRLSRFREQAMAVKTNQEYHAIQHEIAFAESEVKAHEDRILEKMLEADDLSSALKSAETLFASEQQAVDADRRTLEAERAELERSLERMLNERAALIGAIDPRALAIFELVARRRNGVAVAEARDGICTICHVRLRPQVFNTVRRNEDIIQCDSCHRILYFVPTPTPSAAPAPQPAS